MSFLPKPPLSLDRARAIITNAADALEREAIRMERAGEAAKAARIRTALNDQRGALTRLHDLQAAE